MPSRKEDIKFLHAYLKNLREWYEDSEYLVPGDLHEPSEEQRAEYEATEERVARLADANGFNGKLFRDYLFPEPPPLSVEDLRRLGRKIETVPRIIAKLEESEEDERIQEDHAALTDREETVLGVLAHNEGRCLDQETIAAEAELSKEASRGSVRPYLKSLENKGLICRPNGLRKGYVITHRGKRLHNRLLPHKPHATD